ncbi:MAG: hypothetical protein MUF52_01980 [Syntrophobacteraceae bacterium]|jgi:hypothetical protein|nr:hypothetical protein [Syntrophobacteraceae bacterium]
MDKRERLLLPKRSLYYLLVCVGGILAFLLLGIMPLQLAQKDLDSDIAAVEARIEEQKSLFPVFQDLLHQERRAHELGVLLPSSRSRLAQDQIDGISTVLGGLAAQCGTDIVNVTTDLKSLEADVKTLRVRISAKGELPRFRCFLLELCRLPYLESVDDLRVQQVSEGKELHMTLSLALGD